METHKNRKKKSDKASTALNDDVQFHRKRADKLKVLGEYPKTVWLTDVRLSSVSCSGRQACFVAISDVIAQFVLLYVNTE